MLRAQLAELTERLNSLNELTQFWADTTGFPVDIAEIPDILLEPWLLPCPTQAIVLPICSNFELLVLILRI
ncbi:hypothetical protein BC332_28518 [Capsicum chinense]|nr:hypothetical protein BC332_28518 [Capsicum chinense]